MSLKFGLGNSKDDIEIQGEIDYDFFEAESSPKPTNASENYWPNAAASSNSHNGLEGQQYDYIGSARNFNIADATSTQANEQLYIGDSLVVALNCKSSTDAVFSSNVHSVDGTLPVRGSDNPTLAVEDVRTSFSNIDAENAKTIGQEIQVSHPDCVEKRTKYPKKVIETVIPNLEDSPQFPLAVVTNFISPDEENGEKKVDENSGSLSSSMTDSDDTSSLSEESLDALSESESITDVTPLHSPYCCDSPVPQIQTADVSQSREEGDPLKDMDCSEEEQTKKKDAVRFSEELGWCQGGESEPVDLNALVAAIRRLEIQQGHHVIKQRNCITPPLVRPRKNMSFSNEEVRRIDQENQRLLKKILAQQTRSKPISSQPRGSHIASSQVNRHRQQRQAEIDNIALLKRIESAKPSRELSRVKMLRDYNRLSPSMTSRTQSRPSTASSTIHAASTRSGRSHSLPSSSESSTSATPSTSQERPQTAQAISNLHAVNRLQKQRSLH